MLQDWDCPHTMCCFGRRSCRIGTVPSLWVVLAVDVAGLGLSHHCVLFWQKIMQNWDCPLTVGCFGSRWCGVGDCLITVCCFGRRSCRIGTVTPLWVVLVVDDAGLGTVPSSCVVLAVDGMGLGTVPSPCVVFAVEVDVLWMVRVTVAVITADCVRLPCPSHPHIGCFANGFYMFIVLLQGRPHSHTLYRFRGARTNIHCTYSGAPAQPYTIQIQGRPHSHTLYRFRGARATIYCTDSGAPIPPYIVQIVQIPRIITPETSWTPSITWFVQTVGAN